MEAITSIKSRLEFCVSKIKTKNKYLIFMKKTDLNEIKKLIESISGHKKYKQSLGEGITLILDTCIAKWLK